MKGSRRIHHRRLAAAIPLFAVAAALAVTDAAAAEPLQAGATTGGVLEGDATTGSGHLPDLNANERTGDALLAEEAVPFNYYRKGSGFVVYEYTGTGGDVVIPARIHGLPVVAIENPGNVGQTTFKGLDTLTSVAIPASVAAIQSGVFNNCHSLTSIVVDGANANYSSREGILYNKNLSVLLHCPNGKAGTVTIPSGVVALEGAAFRGCSKLTSVRLPDSLTRIENSAFQECTSLSSGSLPGKLIQIGRFAFWFCSSLKSVTIPPGVTTIDHSAFARCSSLEAITLPASVTTIGSEAFSGCRSLKSIRIPPGVTQFGEEAFAHCERLSKVALPPGLKGIPAYGFLRCTSLTRVKIPESVTHIGEGAFSICTGLTSVNIPKKVISIGHAAFRDCRNLGKATFSGNAPRLGHEYRRPVVVFDGAAARFTIYHNPKKTGFAASAWGKYTVKPWFAIYDTTYGPNTGVKRGFKDNEIVKFGVITGGVGRTDQAKIERKFTIKNLGDAPLSKVTVILKGGQAKDFRILKKPAKYVGPGKSTSFTVVYRPKVARTSRANLEMICHIKDANPFRMRIEGTGLK